MNFYNLVFGFGFILSGVFIVLIYNDLKRKLILKGKELNGFSFKLKNGGIASVIIGIYLIIIELLKL